MIYIDIIYNIIYIYIFEYTHYINTYHIIMTSVSASIDVHGRNTATQATAVAPKARCFFPCRIPPCGFRKREYTKEIPPVN